MKKLSLILLISFIFTFPVFSAEMNNAFNEQAKRSRSSKPRKVKSAGSSNSSSSSRYIRGPRGGCYYINGNGNKTYVDRSMCN